MEKRLSDLHFFLKTVGQRFSSVAIFNSEFKCLYINTPYSNNSVGLMQSLKSLKSFFTWNESQIVIHNDPRLGCSRFDRIQFLFTVGSLHFCIEQSFTMSWDLSKTIIKIPPIPIVEGYQLNQELFKTLTAQPDCPMSLGSILQSTIQKVDRFRSDLKNIGSTLADFSNKDLHNKYLAATGSYALEAIKSKTYSSSQIEYELESASTLRIKTTTSELGVRIDFQGTTSNPTTQLASCATESICFYFFADLFQFSDLMNEATYSNFQITMPTHSFVNSTSFSNKLYSDMCGPDLINQALLDSASERLSLKSFLSMKSYYQVFNPDQNNLVLEFSIFNAKPTGSIGITYLFEPLLSSRPTPGGHQFPNLKLLMDFGLEATCGQQVYKTPKCKESNDYLAVFQLTCLKPNQINVINPCLPLRTKLGKGKNHFIKPSLTLNNVLKDNLFSEISLTSGDQLVFKSGAIESI